MKTHLLATKIAILSFLFFSFSTTEAATIKQVKNGKALLVLDGETVKVGDQLFGVNSFNKRTSLLEVTTVKGNQAVAKILKGSASPNDKTEPRSTAAAGARTPAPTAATSPSNNRARSIIQQDRLKVAVNLKVTMDTITAKQQPSDIFGNPIGIKEDVTMKGSNFGVVATVDYPLYPWLSLRGYGGYEMYKIAGTALQDACKNSKDCTVDINYISVGGLLRFNYTVSNFQLWAGIGGSARTPMSKKSSALKESEIQLANTALVALGADYHISDKYFIPASFEYHYSFNVSDSVPKIDQMALLIGFGMMF